MNQTLEFAPVFNDRKTHDSGLVMVLVDIWYCHNEKLLLFVGQVYRRGNSTHEWSKPKQFSGTSFVTSFGDAVRSSVAIADDFIKHSFIPEDELVNVDHPGRD